MVISGRRHATAVADPYAAAGMPREAAAAIVPCRRPGGQHRHAGG